MVPRVLEDRGVDETTEAAVAQGREEDVVDQAHLAVGPLRNDVVGDHEVREDGVDTGRASRGRWWSA